MFRRETDWKPLEFIGQSLGGRLARLLTGLWLAGLPGLRATAGDAQAPSVPRGLSASAVAVTGFTLGWTPSTDNVKVTGYEVMMDGVAVGTTAGLSKRFASLTPGTSYCLTVRSRDGSGNWSVPSPALTVTTALDVTPPTIPGGLTASELTVKGFLLTWAASADDVKATEYEVFRNGESLGFTSSHTKRVTGLRPGTAYAMTVRARDAAGNWSGSSEELTVKTVADTAPPSAPAGLCASDVGATRFVLKWTPAKDNVKVTGYEIFQDGVSRGTTTSVSKAITGLLPATVFKMTVRAGDAAGNWSEPSVAIPVKTAADTTRPSVPAGLAVSRMGPLGFTLGWEPSSDNVGVTGYEVFRDGVSAGTVASPGLDLAGLRPDTVYRVRVRACDAAGNWSAQSVVLKVKTPAGDRTPPSVPGNLVASALTPASFTLSWAPAGDDTGVTDYEVFRDGVSLGRTTRTSMTVTELSSGSSYHMTVRAGDAAGNWSEISAELTVTIDGASVVAGFEPDEGYNLGTLGTQGGWSVTGNAEVVAAPVHGGRQAVSLPASPVASFATLPFLEPAGSITFIDLFALPVAAPTAEGGVFLETGAAEVALMARNGAGQFQVFDGDGHGGGAWISTKGTLETDGSGRASDWQRLTLRTDRSSRRWDLYLNGRMIAANLGFAGEVPAAGDVLSLGGNSAAASGFDEILVGAENPIFADTDRDGMDDEWEGKHGLNPAVNDRDGDRDGDGTSNIQEYLAGTDPAAADTDRDGLTDAEEGVLGTDPNRPDTDGDGIPDGWEISHGLDPRMAADADGDRDGDGQTNAQEFAAGTNPIDFYNGRALYVGSFVESAGINYLYDQSGRLTGADYPSGRTYRYVRDAAGNLTMITATGGSPITVWRAAHGLPADGTGIGADGAILAGDRLPNLAKYAFGLDPQVPVTGEMPVVAEISLGGRSYLALTYRRPDPAPADVTYTVEVSGDGLNWSSDSNATERMGTEYVPGSATIQVRDATPATGTTIGRRIRLKIERHVFP